MGNNRPQLHLLLSGPFVLRDDDDGFRILIPDLMDTHFNPGFTATNNAAELDNGIWTVSFDRYGDPGNSPVNTDGNDFDKFWRRPKNLFSIARWQERKKRKPAENKSDAQMVGIE